MQNPFENPGFSMASLTAAINLLPNRYGRLEQLNLFPAKPTPSRSTEGKPPTSAATRAASSLPVRPTPSHWARWTPSPPISHRRISTKR